ncbi:hypothetical protein [Nocardioides currus]|uniref:DUF559 domain-containing protein n=1 Tax=Nocardioides currus TaxID=2133958 RepID=A0A2R7Z117_9ACTN|nr:hypothetical protein [Nocardioides currus]PUA81946.1 hypothetical protein C7S10_07865 [Nocardioides currus]
MLTEHLLPTGWPLPPDEPFTLRDARAAGVHRKLPALLASRAVRRPLRAVYVSSAVPDSVGLRAACVSLVMPPGCFVTDRCAGWLHGADMTLAPNEDVLVPRVTFFRPSDEGRLRNGLCISGERLVRADDLVEVNGILATSRLRTALDLGRLQKPDVALAGMDSMARLGGVEIAELVAAVDRLKGQRGVVQLRELAPIVDGGSESFGESAMRRRWHGAGLPWPSTQIPIVVDGVEIFRLDLGLEDLMYAAEYDGRRCHTADADREHDGRRRAWLATNRAYAIEKLDHRNVFGVDQDAQERLADGYARARETFASRRRRIIY